MFKISVNEPSEIIALPTEVLAVREQPYSLQAAKEWADCLKQSLCVACAWNGEGKLVGIGFLAGNRRHGTICDLSVHPSVRRNGIGGRLVERLVLEATSQQIRYLGLTFDHSKPWLYAFYTRHGFQSIDFGMWHHTSIAALG